MENTPLENKKSLLQNDRLLVCSMLVFYGICMVGVMAVAFWGLRSRSQIMAANTTATANAFATQRANATSAAVAHATELAQYEMIDPFDTNKNDWITGFHDSEYWSGYRRIQDGVYTWQVDKVKKTFVSWADYSASKDSKDFDVYVDMKAPDSAMGAVCSGIVFRKFERADDTNDYYYFGLCNNSTANISFHGGKEGWERLANVQVFTTPGDWNRLELTARGSHFRFMINGTLVFEMDDDRLDSGDLGLALEIHEQVPATVLFDNFGYQSR
jgi:hypothetical protein